MQYTCGVGLHGVAVAVLFYSRKNWFVAFFQHRAVGIHQNDEGGDIQRCQVQQMQVPENLSHIAVCFGGAKLYRQLALQKAR
jgi:hypothetical protein